MGLLLPRPGNVIVGNEYESGKKPLVVSGVEQEFHLTKNSDLPHVPMLKPATGINMKQVGNRMVKIGSADLTRSAPLFNDPRYTASTLSIPTDDRTLHGLYRFFKDTDPIVSAAIRLSTELPLASLQLGECEDAGVQAHFEEMADRINLTRTIGDVVDEYWTIGNVTLFGAYNTSDQMWDAISVLNPDYVKIESTWVNQKPLVKLIPDESLKKIVQTRSPEYLYKQLSPEIIRYVLYNNEIPLHENNTFIVSHDKAPYEVKGKSLIKRILKILMYEDRLTQAQFAIASRHIVPLTVVKLGDPTTGWIPQQDELDSFREMLSSWELDPSFSIVYHYGINVEFYGASGKILPTGPEFDRIYKLKFIGLGIHEQLMAGAGGSYSQAFANLEIQRQRYLNLQLKIEQLVHIGWFKTVAEMCGFYRMSQPVVGSYYRGKKYGSAKDAGKDLAKFYTGLRDYKDNEEFKEFFRKKTAELYNNQLTTRREYIYPKLDWGSMSASNDENYKNWIKWLREKVPYLVDDNTLARIARLDPKAQEKAYFRDLESKKRRNNEIIRLGLTPYVDKKQMGPDGITGDFGGGGPASMDIGPLTPGAPDMSNAPGAGGLSEEPGAAIGQSGNPPPSAQGQPPASPPGVAMSSQGNTILQKLGEEITESVHSSDENIVKENAQLGVEQSAIDKAIG